MPMNLKSTRLLSISSGAAAVGIAVMAAGSTPATAGSYTAVAMCVLANDYQPAQAIDISLDADGDYNVVVLDRDGDLWDCNASSYGLIYWNVLR